jgi:phosphoribosyl-ATP pyrophosphohydrolase
MLYHWLVVLAVAGVRLDAIAERLQAREGVSGLTEKAARQD